jgi:hypothetical protein
MPADASSRRLSLACRHICAWCQCDLGPLLHPSPHHSYGICRTCAQRYFADLYDCDEDSSTEGLQERAVNAP